MGWRGMRDVLPSGVVRIWPSSKKRDPKGTLTVNAHGREHGQINGTGHRIGCAEDIRFFSSGIEKGPSPLETRLEALFDSLRDPKNDDKDKMELDSTMSYLSGILNVNMENAQLLVVHELVQAPSIGEITKRGFVDGWKVTGVPATNEDHAIHIRNLCAALSSDPALFKKVYKHTFVVGREKDQKALALDTAITYWQILFSPPGLIWETESHNWLDLWESFLREKWTRSVNRDMWNMILEFATKSLEDETLSFWTEDGAWPSVIDDFVEWCKNKGIGKEEGMDVDK